MNSFLIYPGMTDFEEVEILEPSETPGFVYVRPFNSEAQLKVHTSRLVDEATARARKNTKIIQRDGYMVTETTVISGI